MSEYDAEPAEAPPGGPYVQVAAFCEVVVTEASGVNSLIRMVDRIMTNLDAVPIGSSPPPHQLHAVIGLKADQARGSFTLTIQPEAPSGLRLPEISLSVLMEGEDRGTTVHVPILMPTDQEGLYWFDVRLDGQLMTRMPLRVVHLRQSMGAPVVSP